MRPIKKTTTKLSDMPFILLIIVIVNQSKRKSDCTKWKHLKGHLLTGHFKLVLFFFCNHFHLWCFMKQVVEALCLFFLFILLLSVSKYICKRWIMNSMPILLKGFACFLNETENTSIVFFLALIRSRHFISNKLNM